MSALCLILSGDCKTVATWSFSGAHHRFIPLNFSPLGASLGVAEALGAISCHDVGDALAERKSLALSSPPQTSPTLALEALEV